MDIPLDLYIEILTKLPAKSLMRFKCVSKLWSSLIRSRYFSNLRFKVALPPRIYISFMKHLECDSMKGCHNPGESVLVSLVSSDDVSFHEELTMPGIGGHHMVALRGLILYKVCRTACIYNPTTRQSLTLHAIKSNIFAQKENFKRVFYYFGYDPVFDEYKVVCNVVIYFGDYKSTLLEHWVFVLEVGGSWKKVEFSQPHMPTKIELCINGVIYYLASTRVCFDTVVSFDVRSEEFSMIQAPDDVPKFALSRGLIEYGGKPAILDQNNLVQSSSMELWVLEDGGKWSRKSLLLKQCQVHLLDSIAIVTVKGTTRNGEVIFLPHASPSPCYILYYDLQKNDLRKMNLTRKFWEYANGFSDPYNRYYCWELMDKSESIMHLEI